MKHFFPLPFTGAGFNNRHPMLPACGHSTTTALAPSGTAVTGTAFKGKQSCPFRLSILAPPRVDASTSGLSPPDGAARGCSWTQITLHREPPPKTVTLCRSRGIHWLTAAALQPKTQDPASKCFLKREAGIKLHKLSPAEHQSSCPALRWAVKIQKGLYQVTRSARIGIRCSNSRLRPSVLQTGLCLPVCLAMPMATRTVPDVRPQGNTNIFQLLPFILSLG